MTEVTLNVPTKIDLHTIRIWFERDDYLSVTLKDENGKKLAEIEEDASPAFLTSAFLKGKDLVFDIDPVTGIIRNWQPIQADALEADMPGGGTAKSIHLFSKVRDGFCYRFLTAEGGAFVECISDYVPGFMPRDHYGDYVDLEIENATGKILDWHVDEDDYQKASEGQYVKVFWPAKKI